MAKTRTPAQLDVVVLGSHPAAHFAAALLAQTGITTRQLCTNAPEAPDRLVLINPRLFDLHKSLAGMKRKLDLTPIYGLQFLSDEPNVRSEYSGKSIAGYIGVYEQLRSEMRKLAEKEKVPVDTADDLQIQQPDENGLALQIDGKTLHPRLLMLAGAISAEQRRVLGMPESWDHGVLRRYTYLTLRGKKWVPADAKPVMPMSLDLAGKLCWGWLMRGQNMIQLAVEQPLDTTQQMPPHALLKHWITVLEKQRVLQPGAAEESDSAVSIDLPLAGALSQEGVANRTLLIGPAGGFYTACAEEIYPTCWSATFAVDVARKALKERHLQDALQEYRQKWGTTLGDYLRGPQQNLRFLLPLVYRNPVMTTRLAEAILHGKSVVR